jgi:hypothetical protein
MGGEKCQRVLCAGTVVEYLADPGHARSLTESARLNVAPWSGARQIAGVGHGASWRAVSAITFGRLRNCAGFCLSRFLQRVMLKRIWFSRR